MGVIAIKLIVNADDFGYSKGVNYGIVEAYKNGIVRSTSIMMNMDYAEHALKLYRDCQSLGLGIHFVLTSFKPLTAAEELVGDSGYMSPDFKRIENCSEDIIEAELRTQLELLLEWGYKITHADSHHHVHRIPRVLKIMSSICQEYGLAMRIVPVQKNLPEFDPEIKTTESFAWDFYDVNATFKVLEKIFKRERKCSSLEICTHPAFIDSHLKNHSNYVDGRMRELDILTSDKAKDLVKSYGIELANYGSL